MAAILKYPLEKAHQQDIMLPQGASALYAVAQGEALVLYALVARSQPPVPRRVWILGTSQPAGFSAGAKVLGPVLIGRLVYHIFIEPEDYQ